MGKTCIQCGKKLGMFQKPVDEIYCSLACSAAAQDQIAETERKAALVRAENLRVAEEKAKEEAARRAQEQATAKRRTLCPKCGAPWNVVPKGGAGGADAGSCPKCAFSASFQAIDKCPSCDGMTLVVESDAVARCPRCKYRR
jgi:hypothetical protein